MTEHNRVIRGDCSLVLETLMEGSVDAVVCDPPYGLGTKQPSPEEIAHYLEGSRLNTGGDFMGRDWEIPPVSVWRKCFRALKPGGLLLAFAGSRTFDVMDVGIRAAGFEPVTTLAWIYGSGFPKSLNVGKALAKLERKEAAEKWAGWGTALKPSWEPILCFRKPGPESPLDLGVPFFYTGKANRSDRNDGLEDTENSHVTVKPTALMRWLIRIACPKGGLVLDPYAGSGSTLVAAAEEGMDFLGIEIDPVYFEVASKRASSLVARRETRETEADIFARMMDGDF
jgi:DNA modification methylase